MYKEEKIYMRRIIAMGGENHYYISFMDSTGGTTEVEVDADVYEAIREFELIEARMARSDRRYIERFSFSDDEIDVKARKEYSDTETIALLHLCSDEIVKAIEGLTTKQRRRFLLNRSAGMTLRAIAKRENVPISNVQYCVKQTEKKLIKIYMDKRITSIPALTNIDTALSVYYNNLELGNKEIKTLFGERSSATITRLKNAVRNEMEKQNIFSFSANRVNTAIAFQTWGLDVDDLEKRKKKIEALNL